MGECVNDWEENSHGHWGYVKAPGSCHDPGSLPRAVSAGERKEIHQLLGKFSVLRRPLGQTHMAESNLGKEQRPGMDWDSPYCISILLHLLSERYFFF